MHLTTSHYTIDINYWVFPREHILGVSHSYVSSARAHENWKLWKTEISKQGPFWKYALFVHPFIGSKGHLEFTSLLKAWDL